MDRVNENKKKIRFYVVFGIVVFILLNLCWWMIARADGRVFKGEIREDDGTYVEWVPPHYGDGIFIGSVLGKWDQLEDGSIKGTDFRDDFKITTKHFVILPDAKYKICDIYLTVKDNTLTIHYKTDTCDADLDGEDFTLEFFIYYEINGWNSWKYKFHDGKDGRDTVKYTFSPDEIKYFFHVDDDNITVQDCLSEPRTGAIRLYTIRMDDFIGE